MKSKRDSQTGRPLRLLFINYEFPPIGGGGGRATANIVRELAAMGHEVTVMTSAYGNLPRDECRDGYRIVRIPTIRFHHDRCSVVELGVFMMAAIVYSLKWVASNRPDVCIAFFTIPCGPAAYVLKQCYGIPYIVATCGGDIPGQGATVPGAMGRRLRFYHALTRRVIRVLWKQAYQVVATCRGLKALVERSTDRRDVAIIPNGVNAAFFTVKPSANQSSQPFTILTVSRLCPQKGVDLVIHALHLIRDRLNRPWQLWIVGDGPSYAFLEALAYERYGFHHEITFLRWQEAEQIRERQEQSNLFVLASYDEGLSLAVLEAMAGGLPVLGTHISGVEELVIPGENGLLVPPGDVTALAEALLSLSSDEERLLAMGAVSREMARRYNWQDIAEAYAELCRKAV